jgi:hypothetical protein
VGDYGYILLNLNVLFVLWGGAAEVSLFIDLSGFLILCFSMYSAYPGWLGCGLDANLRNLSSFSLHFFSSSCSSLSLEVDFSMSRSA